MKVICTTERGHTKCFIPVDYINDYVAKETDRHRAAMNKAKTDGNTDAEMYHSGAIMTLSQIQADILADLLKTLKEGNNKND